MEIKNLQKRKEVKENYRPEISGSPMEAELKYLLLKEGLRPEQQYKVDYYFADFAFPNCRLLVEYDGAKHMENPVKDFKRHEFLRGKGWNILRIMRKENWYQIMLNEELLADSIFNSDDSLKRGVEIIRKFVLENDNEFADRYYEIREGGLRGGGFTSLKGELRNVFEKLSKNP